MSQLSPVPPNLQKLFQAVDPWAGNRLKVVQKGSLVTFQYVGQTRHKIRDPYPLVIVSEIYADRIQGVNLHYLDLFYMRQMVQYFDNPQFSYAFVKGDAYIVGGRGQPGAFRSYKRNGISRLQMLDTGFIKALLSVVRSVGVNEIEQMRAQIQQQILEQNQQPRAEPTPEVTQQQVPAS